MPESRDLALLSYPGALVSSGVPILQALRIVEETAGNRVVGRVIAEVHDKVKQGDPMAPTLKESGVFPLVVAGMVDVGEQTGALPEMLMKISDTYDDEVDDAVGALTSLLEPIMIVFLAVVVGGIVIAMFLPLLKIMDNGFDDSMELNWIESGLPLGRNQENCQALLDKTSQGSDVFGLHRRVSG